MIKRINDQINYIKNNSVFYKSKLAQYTEIKDISEIKNFPFTTKDDISVNNSDFLCVPIDKIRDFITTSGTMGNPTSFYMTEDDLQRLAINERNSFELCGINTGEKILLTTTLDKCFMAGLAYYLGSQELGVGIIRTGPGSLKYQWDMIDRFKPEIIIGVPSFLLKMVRFAKDNNIDASQTSLVKGICIGEPIRDTNLDLNSLGQQISSSLNIQLFSTYASTEMMTAFTECDKGKGGHLQEDLLFVEVLDKNGNEVSDGDSGEVVITTLGVEAMPLFRYRTGDICTVYRSQCECGRDSLRLGPVLGRESQRLKVKGTTIFPSAIIEAVYSFKHIDSFVIEASLDEFNSDKLCLFVTDDFLESSSLKELKDFLKSKLLFTPDICLVQHNIIDKKTGVNKNRKASRFIDKRYDE